MTGLAGACRIVGLVPLVAIAALAATLRAAPAADAATPPVPGDVAPSRQAAATPSANPLWAIPLKQLTSTRDRPLFSPSRRPPPPVAVAAPAAPPPPPPPKEPERPQLALLGTIVNGSDGYGIFMDQNTNVPVRVRIGAAYQGWTLRTIKAGAATLAKGEESAVVAFPKPSGGDNGRGPSIGTAGPKVFPNLPGFVSGSLPALKKPPPTDGLPPPAPPFAAKGPPR